MFNDFSTFFFCFTQILGGKKKVQHTMMVEEEGKFQKHNVAGLVLEATGKFQQVRSLAFNVD